MPSLLQPPAVLAFSNEKGGSGKTTSCVSVAGSLAARGRRVLVIDLDPQASATRWLGQPKEDTGLLAALLADGDLGRAVRETAVPGLFVIPGSDRLRRVERALKEEDKATAAVCLRRCLLPILPSWEFVLLDCPPYFGPLMVNALAAATHVLIPSEPSPIALDQVPAAQESIAATRQAVNPGLQTVGILLCRTIERENITREAAQLLAQVYGDELLPVRIRKSNPVPESMPQGLPVRQHDPDCAGAQDYELLVDLLLTGEVCRG